MGSVLGSVAPSSRDGMTDAAYRLVRLIERLESPHADKIYVAKGYTKADLIAELRELA